MRCGLSRFAHLRTCSSLDLSDHLGRHLGVRSGTARFEEAGGRGFSHAVVTVGSGPLACMRRQRPWSLPRSSSRAADVGVALRAECGVTGQTHQNQICVVSVLSVGLRAPVSGLRLWTSVPVDEKFGGYTRSVFER